MNIKPAILRIDLRCTLRFKYFSVYHKFIVYRESQEKFRHKNISIITEIQQNKTKQNTISNV